MEMVQTAVGQHYQRVGAVSFGFPSGRLIKLGRTRPTFGKGHLQLHSGADEQPADFTQSPTSDPGTCSTHVHQDQERTW